MAPAIGLNINPSAASTPGEVQVAPQPITTPSVDLTPVLHKIEKIETNLNNKISTLESNLSTLALSLKELSTTTNSQIKELSISQQTNASQISQLANLIETLAKSNTKNDSNGGGTSSAPSTPAVSETVPSPVKGSTKMSLAETIAFLHENAHL